MWRLVEGMGGREDGRTREERKKCGLYALEGSESEDTRGGKSTRGYLGPLTKGERKNENKIK